MQHICRTVFDTIAAIALQTILKPTSPYCHQLRLLLLQTNLKTTPLCCHQTHLLKQTHFEANATLHFVSTYYCLPASYCLQLCLTVSKNALLLTKYWEYLPSAQIMSLVFCNICRYRKSCLQCMMTLPS